MTGAADLGDNLAAELMVIEEQPRYSTDLDERIGQTSRIDAAAQCIGRVDLRLRAQLLQADILGRRPGRGTRTSRPGADQSEGAVVAHCDSS